MIFSDITRHRKLSLNLFLDNWKEKNRFSVKISSKMDQFFVKNRKFCKKSKIL